MVRDVSISCNKCKKKVVVGQLVDGVWVWEIKFAQDVDDRRSDFSIFQQGMGIGNFNCIITHEEKEGEVTHLIRRKSQS